MIQKILIGVGVGIARGVARDYASYLRAKEANPAARFNWLLSVLAALEQSALFGAIGGAAGVAAGEL